MLKVEHVTKKYGTLTAVNDLSFTVEDGEIFGLLGLNGAGKTTTFRMILGLIDDYQGQITMDCKKIDYNVTDKIGFLTEERSLLTKLTVIEQIKLYGVLKGMKEETIEKELDKLLSKFGITEYKTKKIKELSKGNQQKVQFISAIIHKPKLLILDEPFSGLDPINVELFCEKLVVLVKGKSVLEGYLKDIKSSYKKKNLIVKGDINKEELEKEAGVVSITKEKDTYQIKIKDDSYVSKIFQKIAKYPNITAFNVEDASLNEIFIEKVGEVYEK